MQIALLWTVSSIGTGVLVAMLVAAWRHQRRARTADEPNAVFEYVWAMVPGLIVVLAAAPAVHRILASE